MIRKFLQWFIIVFAAILVIVVLAGAIDDEQSAYGPTMLEDW